MVEYNAHPKALIFLEQRGEETIEVANNSYQDG
jgi:hypothetical protein